MQSAKLVLERGLYSRCQHWHRLCLAGSNPIASDLHHTRADTHTIVHLDSNYAIHVLFYDWAQV